MSAVMDVGLVLKSSSFEIDGIALEKNVRNFMKTWQLELRQR